MLGSQPELLLGLCFVNKAIRYVKANLVNIYPSETLSLYDEPTASNVFIESSFGIKRLIIKNPVALTSTVIQI